MSTNYRIKRAAIALGIFASGFTLSYAIKANSLPNESFQQHQTPQEKRKPNPELMKARVELMKSIQEYMQKTVFPELLPLKSKIDGAMSKEDLTTLNNLRSKARVLRDKNKAERREIMKDMAAGNTKRDEAQANRREMVRENRDEFREIASELRPLGEKYQKAFVEIGKSAEPKITKFRKDVQKIISEWREKNKAHLPERDAERMQFPMGAEGELLGLNRGRGGEIAPRRMMAFLLLWDGKE